MTVSSLFEESLSVPFAVVTGSILVSKFQIRPLRKLCIMRKSPPRCATNAYLSHESIYEVLMALFSSLNISNQRRLQTPGIRVSPGPLVAAPASPTPGEAHSLQDRLSKRRPDAA